MIRFLLPIILIPAGIITGYALQGVLKKKYDTSSVRTGIQKITLLSLNPITFLGAIWIAPLSSVKVLSMPLIGAFSLSFGGLLAFLVALLIHLGRKQRGSFITLGAFTNIGSLGGLVVFSLLGEAGFALVPFYKLLEEVMYYGIGFPVARLHSDTPDAGGRFRLLERMKDPFMIAALSGVSLGLILNLSGIPRPAWYAGLNGILIPLVSFLLLVSIGMAMKLQNLRRYWHSGLYLMLIKYLLVPAGATFLAWISELGTIMDGLPLRVVFILSSMPSGFISLIPPSLYNLDLDYANSCWLIVMGGLGLALPWIAFAVRFLIPLIP
ncbi:MAG: hypothetical protein JW760_02280 [Spirochaetales bacterium]|nr:hypothetical protein [Spirochaetales bacterium]